MMYFVYAVLPAQCLPAEGARLSACREMPVDAASETMATSLRPDMKASVSRTFSESSSVESGFARSLYTTLRAAWSYEGGYNHIESLRLLSKPLISASVRTIQAMLGSIY